MDWLTHFLQLAVNGIAAGAMLALPTLSFSLIYASMRLPYFGIAGHITTGAYLGYFFNVALGIPFLQAIPLVIVANGLIGLVFLKAFVEPARGATPITLAVMSVAIAFLCENAVRAIYGNAILSYAIPLERDIQVGFLSVSPLHIRIVIVCVALMAALQVFLQFTQAGRSIRATADNPGLAAAKGVNTRAVTAVVFFIATGLTGISGVFVGTDAALDPGMGLRAILSVFAAAVVGGLGSIPGAILGALAIGLAEELSLLVLPATYKAAVGFFAIIVFLKFRPKGILGR